MSILDDAIREHLELKRQHGAPDDELKKLEDEAFGPPARPDDQADPFAEAATEFMTLPEVEGAPTAEEPTPEGHREVSLVDLQEAPPAPPEPAPEPEAPAEEEHPAMEHEAVTEPPFAAEADEEPGSHTTEERHAIAEQPTEMFDVEGEFSELEAPAPAAEPAPSDEDLVSSELEEPRLAADTATPIPEADAPDFDDEDDFFDEQRLSDELDQALEAPLPPEEPAAEVTAPPTEEAPVPAPALEEDEPISEEHPVASEEHTPFEPHEPGHVDALEDTPEFLEESPEDDQLWFEQKPPKDFDFDD